MSHRRHASRASVEYPRYPPLNSPTQKPPAEYLSLRSPTQLSPAEYPRYPPLNSPTQRLPFEMATMHNMIVSDYESDAPIDMNDLPTALPPITRTKEELNLGVIQKHNREIVSILSVAPYATIYDFASDPEPGWQKSGVVGTLFICQLTPGQFNEERYHAIVLNRHGLENFESELRQSDQTGVEIMDEYVIITKEEDGKSKVNGIYIYSEGEGTSTAAARAANGELMKQLALAASRSRAAAEAQIAQARAASRASTQTPQSQTYQPQMHTPQNYRAMQDFIPTAQSTNLDLLALLQGGQPSFSSTNTTPRAPQQPFQPQSTSYPPTSTGPPQNNVLNDLFRRAGLA